MLLQSEGQFDVIEADAIRPYKAGSGALFSLEFFQIARGRLKDGGYMVQWPATPRVRATFLMVFPYVLEVPGMVMVGSLTPIHIDMDEINARLSAGLVTQGYYAEDEILLVLAQLVGQLTPASGLETARDLNTDLYPRDELGVPLHGP